MTHRFIHLTRPKDSITSQYHILCKVVICITQLTLLYHIDKLYIVMLIVMLIKEKESWNDDPRLEMPLTVYFIELKFHNCINYMLLVLLLQIHDFVLILPTYRVKRV